MLKYVLFLPSHIGESILLCRENDRPKVEELVSSALKPVSSCLLAREGVRGGGEDTLCSAMKRAILEVWKEAGVPSLAGSHHAKRVCHQQVIASGVATTPQEVERYASYTMLATSLSEREGEERSQGGGGGTGGAIEACVKFLEDSEFIR